MVLVEVVEAVVHLRVVEVDIGSEVHKTGVTCVAHTRALIIVSELKQVQLLRVCVEDVR